MSVPSSPGRRPAAVTAAGYLLYGVAALAVVIAALPLPSAGHVADVARHAYSFRKDGDSLATVTHAMTLLASFGFLLAGIAYAALARFDLRGHNGARIATWVLGGAGVLCAGTKVLIARLAVSVGENGNDPQLQAAQKEVRAAYSLAGTESALAILLVLALIAVIFLLMLPVARAYFQPAAPEPGSQAPEPVPAQREQ